MAFLQNILNKVYFLNKCEFKIFFLILENNYFKTIWPLISIESLVLGFNKLSFVLTNNDISICLVESQNPLFLRVDFNKAYRMALKNYSKELSNQFQKEKPFI